MRHQLVWLAAIFAAAALSWQTPSFEVASVKPNVTGGGGRKGGGRNSANDPGLLSLHNVTLKTLILRAYSLQDYQLSGGPGWMENDRYDIDARPAGAAKLEQMMLMLRSLLADRFQLVTRRETRTMAVYVISVAKGGPKFGPYFQQLKEGEPFPPKDNGRLQLGGSFRNIAFGLRSNMSMVDPSTGPIVPYAEVPPILDRTGLDGEYSMLISYDTHEDWPALLEHQFGLKLEARKEPVEMLIVDHAAKPSEN
jgi:uncharacterized protein (TIGR03435 family)